MCAEDLRSVLYDQARRNGMGLAVSRTIVQAHQGRIWVGNKPEQGATFWLAMPVLGEAS